MDIKNSTQRAPKRRRRTVGWAIFGVVSLMLTATWASGVDSSTGSGTNLSSTGSAVPGAAPSAGGSSRFATAVSEVTPLAISYSGRWGAITTDTVLFQVNLKSATDFPVAQTFFVEIALGDPLPTNFSALQLAFVRTTAAGASCAASDITAVVPDTTDSANTTTTDDISWLRGDNSDNTALFTGLAGEQMYCIGVQTENLANDASGSFIRRADPTMTIGTIGGTHIQPTFVAIANQM